MPRTRKGSVPSYRLHRPTGQAVVTIKGHDHYLGQHGSTCSKQKYQRLLNSLLTNDEVINKPEATPPNRHGNPMVKDLVVDYTTYAKSYYQRSDGQQKEVGCIQNALQILLDLYGHFPATEFGPKALKEVRAVMIDKQWSRSYINHQVDRIKWLFRWTVEEEKIPGTVYHALTALRGLRKGHPGVRESRKVRPVSPRMVKATLRMLPPMLRAMVRFQMLTGCRPSEVCRLKPGRLIRKGAIWVYRLAKHKTSHHGKSRRIYMGPRAQRVLTPWLAGLPPEEYVFSPKRSESMRQARRRVKRKTPLWPSHLKRLGLRKTMSPKRPKRDRYDTASYPGGGDRLSIRARGLRASGLRISSGRTSLQTTPTEDKTCDGLRNKISRSAAGRPSTRSGRCYCSAAIILAAMSSQSTAAARSRSAIVGAVRAASETS
jgi:integrase